MERCEVWKEQTVWSNNSKWETAICAQSCVRANKRNYPGEISGDDICDNPICVNPNHLKLGTQKDNIIDMVNKGRNEPNRGESSKKAKLTNEKVLELRRLREEGYSYPKLSRMFGIAESTVVYVVKRRTWNHI